MPGTQSDALQSLGGAETCVNSRANGKTADLEPGCYIADYLCCLCPPSVMRFFRLRRRGSNIRLLVFLLCLFFGSMFLLSGPQRVLCDQPSPSPQHAGTAGPANSIVTAEGKAIPKFIHRIWDSGPIPDRFKGNWEHCQAINPGYNTTLWDDKAIEALIQTHYPWFMPVYRSYPYHMETLDAGRYFIVYHYGGVYIDMDVDCKVSFNEIFKNTSRDKPFEVMIGGGLPFGLATSFFAAPAKHPFMYSLITHLNTSLGWYLTPYWSVMASTGPLYIYRKYLEYACRDQISVLAPHLHKKVYMVHEHAGTWHKWDGPIFVWIDRHLRYVLVGGTLVIVAVVALAVMWRTRTKGSSYRLLGHGRSPNLHL